MAVNAPGRHGRIIVTGTGDRSSSFTVDLHPHYGYLPPVMVCAYVKSAHIQTYLTADEAALLGRELLEAATEAQRALNEQAEAEGAA